MRLSELETTIQLTLHVERPARGLACRTVGPSEDEPPELGASISLIFRPEPGARGRTHRKCAAPDRVLQVVGKMRGYHASFP